jgi:hypothetical protein
MVIGAKVVAGDQRGIQQNAHNEIRPGSGRCHGDRQ